MPYARDMDAQLHRERTGGPIIAPHGADCPMACLSPPTRARRRRRPPLVVWVRDDNVYRDKLARPRAGDATVFTPPSTVEILRAGYAVQIDESALY